MNTNKSKFKILTAEEANKYKSFIDKREDVAFVPIDFLPKQIKYEHAGNVIASLIMKLSESK